MKFLFYSKNIDQLNELNTKQNVILFNGILDELYSYLPEKYAIVVPCTVKLEIIGNFNIPSEIIKEVLDKYGYNSKANNKFISIGSAIYNKGFIFLPIILNYNSERSINYKYAMNGLHRLCEKCDDFDLIICSMLKYTKIMAKSFDNKLFCNDLSTNKNYFDCGLKFHNNQPLEYENLEFIFNQKNKQNNLVQIIEDIIEEEGFDLFDDKNDEDYVLTDSE